MVTVDARCASCWHKNNGCLERPRLLPALGALANELSGPEYEDSPGDGIIIWSCAAFTTTAPA
jgi:hypothetical protein